MSWKITDFGAKSGFRAHPGPQRKPLESLSWILPQPTQPMQYKKAKFSQYIVTVPNDVMYTYTGFQDFRIFFFFLGGGGLYGSMCVWEMRGGGRGERERSIWGKISVTNNFFLFRQASLEVTNLGGFSYDDGNGFMFHPRV